MGPLLVLWVPDYTTLLHPVHIKAASTRPQEIMVMTADVDCATLLVSTSLRRDILDSPQNVSQPASQQRPDLSTFYLGNILRSYFWQTDVFQREIQHIVC